MAVQQLEINRQQEIEHPQPYNHVGVQARLLLGGFALNPNIQLTDEDILHLFDDLHDDFTYQCLNNGSIDERTRYWQAEDPNFDLQKEKWKLGLVDSIRQKRDSLTGSDAERRFTDTFQKMGFDYHSFSIDTAELFYQAWCNHAGGENDSTVFVNMLVNTHSIEELEANIDPISWISNIFGKESAKTIPVMAIAEKKKQDAQTLIELQQQAVVKDEHDIPEVNKIDEFGKEILGFLWEHRPQELDRTITQEIFGAIPIQEVQDRFTYITEPINRSNPNIQKYFIENPPQYLRITPEERKNLQIKESFFIALEEPNVSINPNAGSFVHELAQPDETGGDARYRAALEQMQDKEHGYFELAAAIAPNPEDQARLYSLLTGQVIQTHIEDPELIYQWLVKQGPQRFAPPSGKRFQPLLEFARMDHDENGMLKTDNNSLLLRYTPNHQLDVPSFIETWHTRATELEQAYNNSNLLPQHYKWLEFIGHSINITRLIEIIKAQQPV